jgi:hypothetical protein
MNIWPFNKGKRIPGVTVKSDSLAHLELTQEEKAAVKRHLDLLRAIMDQHKPAGQSEGEWAIPKEELDCFVAVGLWEYAEDNILALLMAKSLEERTSRLDKAFAAVMKAYSICPVPILMYDAAWLTEMLDKPNNAADSFRAFLVAQEQFQPQRIHEPLLLLRNVDHAIASAKRAASGHGA